VANKIAVVYQHVKINNKWTFKKATDPSRWLVEGQAVDLITSTSDNDRDDSRQPKHSNIWSISSTFNGEQPRQRERIRNLLLELASLSENRRGIPEGKFISLLASRLGLNGTTVWGVARAWTEAGHFEILSDARWRARVYFAIKPRLVCVTRGRGLTACLVGLSPYFISERFAEVSGSLGMPVSQRPSVSDDVPQMFECQVSDGEAIKLLSKELGLDQAPTPPPPEYSGLTIREMAESRGIPAKDNWLYLKSWDWTTRYFSFSPRLDELNQISLTGVDEKMDRIATRCFVMENSCSGRVREFGPYYACMP
jgi:hypothetical protein